MSLEFNPDTHTYTVDGQRVPCVSDLFKPVEAFDCSPQVLQQAALRGTMVHEYCELIDYGTDPDSLEVNPDLTGYVLAYLRFLRDYKPQWECIEQPLYRKSLNLAGTMDRYGIIDGEPVLLDIKTSSSVSARTKKIWATKLYAYRGLCNDFECKAWNLLLKKDGTYTIYDAKETEEKYSYNPAELFDCLCGIYGILEEK